MAITDMPERFTLGEVEIALEVKRIRFMHQSRLVDEISNIIFDPRGGMGQKLQLGRLREIVIYAGTKSLRMKGPSQDPDLEGWKTVDLGNGTNPYANFPDYEDDEYAQRLIPELMKRILTHNRFLVQDGDFGQLFRGYLPEKEETEADPTPPTGTSTAGASSTSGTPSDPGTPPTQETTENSVGSMT